MLLDATLWEMLSSRWHITDICWTKEVGLGGLLNDPIQKLLIRHDGIETIIAVKTLGPEPRLLFRSLYDRFGFASRQELENFDRHCSYLSMREMPLRERAFYENHNEAINDCIPKFYGCIQQGELFYLLMEDLGDCRLINQVEHPEYWREPEIELAIDTMAYFHSISLCPANMFDVGGGFDYGDIAEFLESLTTSMRVRAGMERIAVVDTAAKAFISHLTFYEGLLSEYGKKLTHHDYNIRNICIDQYAWKLKVYDWEFIDYENPLMDMVDFLASISSEALSPPLLEKWLTIYQDALSRYGMAASMEEIKRQLYCCLLKFTATRMNMYLLFYCRKKESYMERLYKNLGLMLSVLEKQVGL